MEESWGAKPAVYRIQNAFKKGKTAHLFEVEYGDSIEAPSAAEFEDTEFWRYNESAENLQYNGYEVRISCPIVLDQTFKTKLQQKVVEITKSTANYFEKNEAWREFLEDYTASYFIFYRNYSYFGNLTNYPKVRIVVMPLKS